MARPFFGWSGGILCLWKKWIVEVKYHFFGVGFMGFCVACVKIRFVFHFVNVYLPCNLAGKRKGGL